MYKHADEPIFDIDILKYAQIDKISGYDGHKKLKDEFREIDIKQNIHKYQRSEPFQQQNKRSLPKILVGQEQSSCFKEFCSSYWYLILCWLILIAILCTSIFLYVKCETMEQSYDHASFGKVALLNTTRIPSWEDLTESEKGTVTTASQSKTKENTEETTTKRDSRPTYFPVRLNYDKKEAIGNGKKFKQTEEESKCSSVLFVLLIIFVSFGILFVVIFGLVVVLTK
jgi:hypothetical protein